MSSCGRVKQEEVLLTGTELINVTIIVIRFIAFCDTNVIMHGSAITHESIRIEPFGSVFDCYPRIVGIQNILPVSCPLFLGYR
jgi:hypothetical protein